VQASEHNGKLGFVGFAEVARNGFLTQRWVVTQRSGLLTTHDVMGTLVDEGIVVTSVESESGQTTLSHFD
jgi:hypothetical protein